jgi:hypothetical protein
MARKPKNAVHQAMINQAKKMAKSGKGSSDPRVNYPNTEAVRSLIGMKTEGN